jgi:hypothetical protein
VISLDATALTVGTAAIDYPRIESVILAPGSGSDLAVSGVAQATLLLPSRLASLSLYGTSKLTLAAGGSLLRAGGLSIEPGATLDLADNDLVLQRTPANKAADLAAVFAVLATGHGPAGSWAGPGINSSAAAGDATHLTGLALQLNDDGTGSPIRTLFEGESVDENSILVKYTYNGDADLNGRVNVDDYFAIDLGFANALNGFARGDFNYSGVAPDADDYFLIDQAFLGQGAPLATSRPRPLTQVFAQAPAALPVGAFPAPIGSPVAAADLFGPSIEGSTSEDALGLGLTDYDVLGLG